MAKVILENICKVYPGGFKAVDNANLEIHDQEFIVLVGPSGCGKSTVLRLIAGLIAPTNGTVKFEAGKPETAFVFQEPTLMPWANALTNARLALDLENVPQAEAEPRAAAALARRFHLAGHR